MGLHISSCEQDFLTNQRLLMLEHVFKSSDMPHLLNLYENITRNAPCSLGRASNFDRSFSFEYQIKKKLHGLSPRANYTDRATAACRLSDCQHFADRGCHVVSVTDP
jgi:hypothetical protein